MIGLPLVLKLLTPSNVRAVLDYVFKKNVLDEQMESVQTRLDEIKAEYNELKKDLKKVIEESKVIKCQCVDFNKKFNKLEKGTRNGNK